MPNKFAYRSREKELLDGSNIQWNLLCKNLNELDILDRAIGGHALSVKSIKQLMTDRRKIYHIVDLGCGNGDFLKFIADWSRVNCFRVKLTGVDMNAGAIEYLKIHCAGYPELSGVEADYDVYLNAIDVLIIGAGLTVLKMGDLLALHQVSFRIIDKAV